MKTFKLTYSGNSTFLNRRIENNDCLIDAETERDAVESFYSSYFDENYFPQEDGIICDCSGNCIAEPNDTSIWYDGGHICAELVDEN